MASRPAPRELVLVVEPAADLQVTEAGFLPMTSASLGSLKDLLVSEGASLQPLFGLSEELLEHRASLISPLLSAPPYLSLFYNVSAPDSQLESLAGQLRDNAAVQAVYVKPGVELPIFDSDLTLLPGPNPPPLSPIFSQEYLGPPPAGLNAISAAELPGGNGAGTNLIDIEGAWRFTHEDLKQNQGGVAGGIQYASLFWRDHGTAVLGIVSGDANSFGITGICPEAHVRAVSVFGQHTGNFPQNSGTAAAIRQATDLLVAGDILIIEMQAPGPPDFQVRDDQLGYVPVEWWPDNMAAIQYAIKAGVIVVEAAGNGACNLDDPIYDHSPGPTYGPFPSGWSNPFRRTKIDTGSIIVGAGAPPLGTNDHNWGPDRSRLAFSNFGSMVDAQGWGYDVTTCGYGKSQQGPDEDRWYTLFFNGTSSATPMVAGALACVQGVLRKANKPLLTPARARELLRTTGSPQQAAPDRPISQRIGNRPDIMEMISKLASP